MSTTIVSLRRIPDSWVCRYSWRGPCAGRPGPAGAGSGRRRQL